MPLLGSPVRVRDGDNVVVLELLNSYGVLRLGHWRGGYHVDRSSLYMSHDLCSYKKLIVWTPNSAVPVYPEDILGVLRGKPPEDVYTTKKLLNRIAFVYRDLIRDRLRDTWYRTWSRSK